jgi:hypothetical protein
MVAKKVVSKNSFWRIKQLYFIRTITMYVVGELVAIDEHEITLRDAAWIADTGRFNEALQTGKLNEVEPAPEGISIVGRGSIVDAYLWPHGPLRMVI